MASNKRLRHWRLTSSAEPVQLHRTLRTIGLRQAAVRRSRTSPAALVSSIVLRADRETPGSLIVLFQVVTRGGSASSRSIGFSRADLHIHTTCSDGTATPEQVARLLASSDLAVAAVTDHDTLEGALRVREALAGRGPEIVIGTEVSSADGHILALFVDRAIPAARSARETVGLIRESGGLAIAAHPYFPIESLGALAACLPFDAVEVANGTLLGEWGNLRARRCLATSARALVGGSDAHVLAAVGHVQTLFPGRTAADLRLAIERGVTIPAFAWRRHVRIAPALAANLAGSLLGDFLGRRVEPQGA